MKERLARLARSRWFRWGERVVTAALLVFVAWRLWPQLSAWTGVAELEGTAPRFEVATLAGDTVASDALRGRVVLVNFWATWCGPCRLEMPALQRLHEAHADEGLVVLGLSIDADPRAVPPFLEARGITYPIAMAGDEERRAFGGLPGVPTTFILDRNATVRPRVFGYFAPPAMAAAVRRLLENGDSAGADGVRSGR